MSKIITRQQAKVRGLTRYFTGVPCKWGHVAPRETACGSCVECTESWRMRNAEKVAEARRRWRAANVDRIRAYNLAYKKG